MNLLEETLEILAKNNKTADDVLWVGSKDGKYAITWEQFTLNANIDYDNGYGGNEIRAELVVVGENWWLERGEYDGAEWWEFKILPTKFADAQPFNSMLDDCYEKVWQ